MAEGALQKCVRVARIAGSLQPHTTSEKWLHKQDQNNSNSKGHTKGEYITGQITTDN